MTPKLGDRSLFPDLKPRAYLNHAAISPPSTVVRAAVDEVLCRSAELGAGAFRLWLERRAVLRQRLAELIGAASADDIAFVPNTSRGVTDIALCFPWRAGDRVVLIEGEFPANVTPWQRAAELFDLRLVFLPKPTPDTVLESWLAQVEIELSRGARLLAVSAVQFQTGLRMPLQQLGELCARHGCQHFVDAIQACGVVPVDVQRERIDYLSCGSHKWLMGLEGAGLLYVAPERAAVLRPHVAGWLGHADAMSFLFEGPGRLRHDRPLLHRAQLVEGGMANTVGLAALAASVGCIMELGVDAIFDHVTGYLDALEKALIVRGFVSHRAVRSELRSGIASFEPPEDVDVIALHRAIDSSQVSCTTPDGLLRFAPHWPNGLGEIEVVAAVMDAALGTLRP